DKLAAKRMAAEAGVPVVPSGEPAELGYPLLVKAAAGGGGRGMRVVREPAELEEALAAASREAEAAFGDGAVFCERYVERPRHVEIQLLADAHGTTLSLGERECSVQRRHQKVLEESPSPALDPFLRAAMSEAAVAFARAVGYVSAGTAEFMLDGRDFYFLELNGRIQVEHPVTELVSGIDLVAEQIRIAEGERLEPSDSPLQGHAVEVRLYAEDPRTFLPRAGPVERLRLPRGIRVDAGVAEGDEVGLGYDPMLAKLIAHGPTRDEALARLADALAETEVEGIATNLPFLRWLVAHPALRAGETTTAFLVEHPPLSEPPLRRPEPVWRGGWRLNLPPAPTASPPNIDDAAHANTPAAGESTLSAPMPGTVLRVLVRPCDRVAARQQLLLLEAMKMETPIVAPYDATVKAVHVEEGARVAGGSLLVELEGG
ncbi:MAG: biotin/lipoyl-containing protein, partial [Gaiellaceae bacterium]